MKMIAPNIARPITKPSEEATLNTLERNRFSGMIGSGARRSWKMKATISSDAGDRQADDRAASPTRTRSRPRW